jgi:hypothetical protein
MTGGRIFMCLFGFFFLSFVIALVAHNSQGNRSGRSHV